MRLLPRAAVWDSSALWGSQFPECAGERRSTEAAVSAYRKAQTVHGVPALAHRPRAVSDLALPEPSPPSPPPPSRQGSRSHSARTLHSLPARVFKKHNLAGCPHSVTTLLRTDGPFSQSPSRAAEHPAPGSVAASVGGLKQLAS